MEHTRRRIARLLVRFFYWVLYALVGSMFFTTLHHYLVTAQFGVVALVCGPTLAILFGFCVLLYGRARAFRKAWSSDGVFTLPSGPCSRRLYS
jgi:hypothetical protein